MDKLGDGRVICGVVWHFWIWKFRMRGDGELEKMSLMVEESVYEFTCEWRCKLDVRHDCLISMNQQAGSS